jgi:hypothetical protein
MENYGEYLNLTTLGGAPQGYRELDLIRANLWGAIVPEGPLSRPFMRVFCPALRSLPIRDGHAGRRHTTTILMERKEQRNHHGREHSHNSRKRQS